ncbi:MAG: TonB-dependent receptor [Deltaproteobacteria bacterium]|nr:TonB-dependent receptor [Deltaproteobacteria bacterium]
MVRRAHSIGLILLGAALAPAARAARVVDLPETVVDTEAAPPEDVTTATTTVRDPTPAAGEDLTAVLRSVPGVHLRQSGGPDSFTTVSIRGAGPNQIAVILDDLPLASATLGPIDLSLIPPESIARLEVWRGAAPVRFASPQGGVLSLTTHTPADETRSSARLAIGSFHTRSGHAFASGPAADLRYAAYVGYRTTRGDYPYLDDRGTIYNAGDDQVRRRQNNAATTLTLRLKAEADGVAGSTLRVVTGGALRDQGVPGRGAAPTLATHASQAEASTRFALVDADLADHRLRLNLGSDLLQSLRQFSDPDDKSGLNIRSAAARLLQLGADARASYLFASAHEAELAPRVEWTSFTQASAGRTPALNGVELERQRLHAGAGLEHRADLTGGLRLVPAVRVDTVRDRDRGNRPTASTEWSPRLGALVTLDPCALRANAGWFHRFPTLLERYGDLVTATANPNLVAEHGVMADLGGRCRARAGPFLRLEGELTLFGHDGRDLIVVVPNSRRWLRAENLGRARSIGAELEVDVRTRFAAVLVAYTVTRAAQVSAQSGLDGNRIPGLPGHRLDATLQLGPEWLVLSYELSLASQTYLDLPNLWPVPRRLLHHAALKGQHAATGLGFGLTVTNVLDSDRQQIRLPDGTTGVSALSDFLGYPIPGRSFVASLTWKTP